MSNPFINKKIEELNYKKNGYYLDKNEKIIDLNDNILISDKYIREFYKNFFNDDNEALKKFISLRTHNNLIEVPYINLINQNKNAYINPILLNMINGSNGFAAGNNLYEALNQGISELIERYALTEMIYNNNFILHKINKKSIKNKNLLRIINNIESMNNELIIFDLSYNINLPVMGIILFNRDNCDTVINLGSFPIFDIALERCLTEVYQNLENDNCRDLSISYTEKITSKNIWHMQVGGGRDQNIFPEKLLKNVKNVNEYNKSEYIQQFEISNKQINDWLLQKTQQKNIDLYFRDISLTNQMCAVHVYSPQMSFVFGHLILDDIKKHSNQEINFCLDRLKELYLNFELYISTNTTEYLNKIIEFYNLIYNDIKIKDLSILLSSSVIWGIFNTEKYDIECIPLFYKIANNSFYSLTDTELNALKKFSNTGNLAYSQNKINNFILTLQLAKSGYNNNFIKEIYKKLHLEYYDINDTLFLIYEIFFSKFFDNNFLNELLAPMIIGTN